MVLSSSTGGALTLPGLACYTPTGATHAQNVCTLGIAGGLKHPPHGLYVFIETRGKTERRVHGMEKGKGALENHRLVGRGRTGRRVR